MRMGPHHPYSTHSFFAGDLHCEIVCLAVSPPLPPWGSCSLVFLPACSLVSALVAFLFLVTLVANLVISKVPGREMGLPSGNASSCGASGPAGRDPIPLFHR